MKMRRSKFVAGSMIFAAGSLTLQSSQADIYISQYYEGASNNKWIEIYNSGESAVDLGAGGFRYGIWNNSPANIGWKTSTTANGSFSISATISAGGVLTLANSSSALPFAASRANIANGTVNFNGDDSVVIYTGTPYAFANVVDAFGMTATSTTGSPGTDQSWSRKTSVTTGVNTDFSSASWDGFSNAAVDGAAVTTDERIGVYKRGGISVVWDVNGTTALTGGTGIWNVSSTFFTSKAGGSGTAGDYYAYNESTNRRDNVIFGGTAGVVTLPGDRTTGGLVFTTTGYQIAGSDTLFFDGTGNIDVVGSATTATISSKIGTTSGVNIRKLGAGNLILSGANTYTGTTTVTAGTLSISSTGALPSATAVTVAAPATFDISAIASSQTIGSIAGAGNVLLGGKSLDAGGDDSSTTFSGAMSGAGGSFTKSGTGVLTLSGANDYTGTTTVAAGTLRLNGTHTGGGAYTVGTGATLGGSGVTTSAVTIQSGGTLSPGNSIDTITVGSLNLEPSAT